MNRDNQTVFDDALINFYREIDVGILTIIPIEIEAIFETFSIDCNKYETMIGGSLQYWRTSCDNLPSKRSLSVVISILGGEAGNIESAIATTQFLRDWHPRLMCLVGIAAGIKGKIDIGHVIVPSKVHDHTLKVFENNCISLRGSAQTRNEILNRMLKIYPLKILSNELRNIHVHQDGSIISDNVLIRDSSYFDKISEIDQKCRGAEMEAVGFVSACQKQSNDFPWIIFRGISDFGDSEKNDFSQKEAAKNACTVLKYFIDSRLNIDQLPLISTPTNFNANLIRELYTAFDQKRWKQVCRIGEAISRTLWLSGHLELRYEIGHKVEHAAALLKNNFLRARTLIDDMGWTAIKLGAGQEDYGWKHIEDGIHLGKDYGDYYAVAKGYRHLIFRHQRNNELEKATEYLKKAREATPKITDENERTELQNSLKFSEAELEIARGNFIEAIPLLEHALQSFQQFGDSERAIKIYRPLAICYEKQGDIQKAKQFYMQGLELARNNGRFDELENNTIKLLDISQNDPQQCDKWIQEVYDSAVSHGLWDKAKYWQRNLSNKNISHVATRQIVP